MRTRNNARAEITETGEATPESNHLKSEFDQSTQRLNNIITGIPGIAWETFGAPDSIGEQVQFINDYAEVMLGYSAAEWLADPEFLIAIIHPDDRTRVLQTAAENFALRQNFNIEFRWMAKDGHAVWVEMHAAIKYDAARQPTGLRGITVDITKRKQLEEERDRLAAELKQQQQRLQHIFDHSPSFIVVLRGPEMVFEMANPAYYQLIGERELIGRTVKEVLPELEHQGFIDLLKDVYLTGKPFSCNEVEVKLSKPNSTEQKTLYLNFSYAPLREPDGTISGVLSYGVNVTEQVTSRIRAEESEQRYLHLFKSNPLPMWVFDRETLRFLAVNEAAVAHYGYSEAEFLEMSIMELRLPEDVPAMLEHLNNYYSGLNKTRLFRHLKKDGTLIDVDVIANPITFNGRDARLVMANDITERQKAESALSRAEENYRHLVESSPGIVYLIEPIPPYSAVYISPNVAEIGYSPEDWYANAEMWASIIYADDREYVAREFEAAAAQGFETELKYRIVARDGAIHWWKDKRRFVLDEHGTRTGWQGIILDITATKELEEQLRQAQKLEAVGLLAGGIAHDFNNMLTAINGYSDLTLLRLKEEDPLRQNIVEIKKAGMRSTALTQQLLAFSRQQVLQPKLSDPNEIITDTIKLLRRLIGEDVNLHTALNPESGKIMVDPGQLAQIIMNLAVNSRDAMPQGGKLTIETANVFLDRAYTRQFIDVQPGAYVLIAVSDNGFGMTEETKRHIFEPFFTTKELGHGTGLGLATVYGIIKQSGGTIDVYSELGIGTTFKIYLPCVVAESDESSREKDASEVTAGTETILLVEDEELVRNLSRQILESCGYTVVEASNGLQALEICNENPCRFDLLMTDVVMPQMSGRELAEILRMTMPRLPVLFTSGYTDDAVVRHGVIEANTNFLQKPFTMEALSNKIREIFKK